MVGIRRISPVVRAIGVIGAVSALVTGVTFAALNSTATLTNNSFSTVGADLVLDIGNDSDQVYDKEEPGFDFDNLVPGTESPTYAISLRNEGETALDVTVNIPSATIPAGLDATKVDIKFTKTGGTDGESKTFTLSDLTDGTPNLLIDNLDANSSASVDYNLTVLIKEEAVNGEGDVSVEGFNIVFNGTQDSTPPVETLTR